MSQANFVTRLRAASESIRRVAPLKIILIATSVPITHSVLAGQVLQIIIARIGVTIPSSSSHPQPCRGRIWNDRISSSRNLQTIGRLPSGEQYPGLSANRKSFWPLVASFCAHSTRSKRFGPSPPPITAANCVRTSRPASCQPQNTGVQSGAVRTRSAPCCTIRSFLA